MSHSRAQDDGSANDDDGDQERTAKRSGGRRGGEQRRPYLSGFARDTGFVIRDPRHAEEEWAEHLQRLEQKQSQEPPFKADPLWAGLFQGFLDGRQDENWANAVETFSMDIPQNVRDAYLRAAMERWRNGAGGIDAILIENQLRAFMGSLRDIDEQKPGYRTNKWYDLGDNMMLVPFTLLDQPIQCTQDTTDYFHATPIAFEPSSDSEEIDEWADDALQGYGSWHARLLELRKYGLQTPQSIAKLAVAKDGRVAPSYSISDVTQARFWFEIARGGHPRAGLDAGMFSYAEASAHAEILGKKAVKDAVTEYTDWLRCRPILSAARGGSGDRAATAMANVIQRAIQRAPNQYRPILLTRFQEGFHGWEEVPSWQDGTGDQKKAARRALFETWRASNTILSTSHNPAFTFATQANLYIIYHLHPDCKWLWIANEGEAEVLLPPGLEMCAMRTAYEKRIGAYIVEVLARPQST